MSNSLRPVDPPSSSVHGILHARILEWVAISFSKNTERPPEHININKTKRQRNTQQIKEQEKCPPTQPKDKEIGNLPEKEFQIMIVKMIQNLEIKMESQINSLETGLRRCK